MKTGLLFEEEKEGSLIQSQSVMQILRKKVNEEKATNNPTENESRSSSFERIKRNIDR